ncbi:(d)CMP kinase [Pelomicrobium sp. G1]|uniref:(d)CMP kinase n=1 Tax=unclassified Pelomicrobium TaxID=2815318 RepID=UPI000B10FFE9|nr:MAG: cytidylate kinase [Burkholderiales bacterium]
MIAIDGPSASGKGTIAQGVARALGFHYLDSGALYRLVALAARRQGIGLSDPQALAALAQGLEATFDGDQVILEGERVTDAIRSEEVSQAASRVAALAPVRSALLARQRAFRQPPGLVAEGRDMGTQVFPDARLKIFLTASAEERARRRYKQLMDKGMRVSMSDLVREIAERDRRDRERAVAPLRQAEDAVLIDTTSLTVDEIVRAVVERYRSLAPC